MIWLQLLLLLIEGVMIVIDIVIVAEDLVLVIVEVRFRHGGIVLIVIINMQQLL
jgi:hypothetical protein